MILKIKSEAKDSKFIYIDNEKIKVEGDIFEFIKKTLKEKNLKLTDFEDFVAKPSASFTGVREAVTIVNTLKYLIKKVPIESLKFPKYHKKPNINIK